MDAAFLAARLALAAVFAVAGLAKLADRGGTRRTMEGFGAPSGLAAPIAAVVPVAELATAALLAPSGTARAGAIAALALLLGFSIAIAANVARGRMPDCRCLGQLASGPAGPGALARNFALAVLAGFVLVAEPS